ncbi:MAG: helix-turn-helix transcriptional regulator [Chloroflexi bacterium]|nr:helix-turn-helix transcriptional regulator [Chloroflexota bacterium]
MEDETIGKRIERARERRVLGRTELAREAGLSYEALYLIETGKRQPRRATIRKIAAALGIDPHDLLTGAET